MLRLALYGHPGPAVPSITWTESGEGEENQELLPAEGKTYDQQAKIIDAIADELQNKDWAFS